MRGSANLELGPLAHTRYWVIQESTRRVSFGFVLTSDVAEVNLSGMSVRAEVLKYSFVAREIRKEQFRASRYYWGSRLINVGERKMRRDCACRIRGVLGEPFPKSIGGKRTNQTPQWSRRESPLACGRK